MKRVFVATIIAAGLTVATAAPAAAHVIVIDPPGKGETKVGWVGSPAEGIPGKGKGLTLGGELGTTVLSPSHSGGLVSACKAIRENGNGKAAADIFGPPFGNCNHGGPPPPAD